MTAAREGETKKGDEGGAAYEEMRRREDGFFKFGKIAKLVPHFISNYGFGPPII